MAIHQPPQTGAQAPDSTDVFSQLVRKIVIQERRGVLRSLAATLGLSYGAFYNRLIGRASFTPPEINLLLQHLDDPRLADCLLAGTNFHAVQLPLKPAHEQNTDIADTALVCAVDTLDAVKAMMDALRGRHLDRQKGAMLVDSVRQVQRRLSILQLALSKAHE